MKDERLTSHIGKEKCVVYTGVSMPAFIPIVAGVTLPDPDYMIYRNNADIYVFEYVLEGKGYICRGREETEVHGGDAYILRPGETHYYYSDPEIPWTKVWLNARGSLIRHLLSDYGLDGTAFFPGFGQRQYLYAILDTMEKDPVKCYSELTIQLHEYIQALSVFNGKGKKEHTNAYIMKNYIEQNLTRSITVDDMAARVHLSASRAIHVFKEAFGISPYQYYHTQRLELSQSMLLYTEFSIQEIADRLGFLDYHHFSNSFKKAYGVSPVNFRKSL